MFSATNQEKFLTCGIFDEREEVLILLDPAGTIERILEAKGLFVDEEAELKRQYEIFKRIRNES